MCLYGNTYFKINMAVLLSVVSCWLLEIPKQPATNNQQQISENKKIPPDKGRENSRGTTLMTFRPLGTVNDVPSGLFFPEAPK